MDLWKWFDTQLQTTLDGFVWAVHQVPEERWYAAPPAPLGDWCAAQHISHMVDYENKLALPSMHQWLGAPPPVREAVEQEERDSPAPVETMLAQFSEVRLAEIDLLARFAETAWKSTQKTTFWGEVSLYWLVCKTYQHTLDHTKELLALALFWDRCLARTAQE